MDLGSGGCEERTLNGEIVMQVRFRLFHHLEEKGVSDLYRV